MALVSAPVFSAESTAESAVQYEALDSIRETAENFALNQVDHENLRQITATAVTLDSRLQLNKCESPLEAFAATMTNNIARMTVGIRCIGDKPWTLYVPININAIAGVIFPTRPLSRGEILQRSDLEIRELPLSNLPANYLSQIDELTGMELTRPVNTRVALTLNAVKTRNIVQQGQAVIILAKGGSIEVRMNGTAMRSGSYGDLIPVLNITSGRTIEATVLNESTVSVNM